ncbi:MAG: carboxypeptidase regulatory-like domain-containing protein, partial [Schleiferiaceae bacterium]|nr:carboxypeptidase regulatory-like domain-containing protein [Schleiferiaceae bacterium]
DGENKISILPDSSKVVQVDVLPKLNVYEITGYSYGLVLRTDSIMLKNDVSVKVLPNTRDKIDPYKRYVVRTNLRYLGRYLRGEYSDGYQFNINGSGELKRPGHQFDFVIQGPNSSELSLNSTFSQYSARYEAPKFIIQGGHGSYSVSRLIENSRNGFGGQLAYKAEKWKASAFYVKPRFYPQITGQSGATFDYNFKRESRLGLNYMNKQLALGQFVHLFSTELSHRKKERYGLEAEVAYGFSSQESGVGLSFGYNSKFKNVRYSFNGLWTSQDYPGYFRNTLIGNASIGLAINEVSIILSGNYSRANPINDTTFIAAPYYWETRLGLSKRLQRYGSINANAGLRSKQDRFSTNLFDYQEIFGNIFFNVSLQNKHFFKLTSEYALTRSFIEPFNGTPTHSARFGLNITSNLTQRLRVTLNNQYINDVVFANKQQGNWVVNGIVSYGLGRSFNVYASYQNTFAIEDFYLNRNQFLLGARGRIAKNHVIDINSNYFLQQGTVDQLDLNFSVDYTYFLGIPVSKIFHIGNVIGKVTDEEGRPIKNAIVYLNGEAVGTDRNGNYEFKNLKVGEYYLNVDRSSMGNIRRMPMIQLPYKVKVEEDQEVTINIVTRLSGSVKGTTTLQKVKNSKTAVTREVEFPKYMVLSMENELGELQRTTSNSKGNFVFSDLKPGKWKLTVHTQGLDKNIMVVNNGRTINIEDGEDKEVKIVLKQKARRINFQNSKTIKIGK